MSRSSVFKFHSLDQVLILWLLLLWVQCDYLCKCWSKLLSCLRDGIQQRNKLLLQDGVLRHERPDTAMMERDFVTSRCSSWHDGKGLGVPDSVLLNGKEPYRYNDYLLSDGIEYATIIVLPQVILCLTLLYWLHCNFWIPLFFICCINPWAW
jgi:hypothetical protein